MDTDAQLVPTVVTVLARGLARVLGSRLVGVYLGGSASVGDFVPATSDYDVLVVSEGVLTPEDLGAIAFGIWLESPGRDLRARLMHLDGLAAGTESGVWVRAGQALGVPGVAFGRAGCDGW